VPARYGSTAVAVSPDDTSAYVADGSGTISQYSIDPTTGTLRPKSPATVPAGHQVEAIAITPDGRSAYVPGETASKVWQYSIDPATGKLTSKSPATVPAAHGSAALAVTPDADASVSMRPPASVTSGSRRTYTIKSPTPGPQTPGG
jgi:sugar lactone lactonase YvrE